MTKIEFIKEVAKENDMTYKEASDIVISIFQKLQSCLKSKKKVNLGQNFGIFKLKEIKERVLTTPFCQNMHIPSHDKIIFKPSVPFKYFVNS